MRGARLAHRVAFQNRRTETGRAESLPAHRKSLSFHAMSQGTISAHRRASIPSNRPGAPLNARPSRSGITLRRALVVLWLLGAGAAALPGLAYYRMDAESRAYSDLHALFAPTGLIGHSLGYLGTTMIVVGVAMYALRKRLPLLQGVGRLPVWLQVHIFLCTLGAYLVVLHTSFRLGGLAAVAFWAMVVAVLSGIVGRYLYVRVPRARDGHERSLAEVRARVEELSAGLAGSGIDADRVEALLGPAGPAPRSVLRALLVAPAADLRRRVRLARVRAGLRGESRSVQRRVLGALDERLRLEQQIAFLAPVQRLLGYWHVLHIPIAMLMFIALGLHVGVAILFGYGWPFR